MDGIRLSGASSPVSIRARIAFAICREGGTGVVRSTMHTVIPALPYGDNGSCGVVRGSAVWSDQHMNQADANQFANLRYHWGRAYEITANASGWTATRRDDGSAVHCRTAAELAEQIRRDYQARPVPHYLPGLGSARLGHSRQASTGSWPGSMI